MSQQKLEADKPYVTMGYQIQEVLSLLQLMPRSTDALCRKVEDVVLNVQVLQPAPPQPQPVQDLQEAGATTAPPTV